MTYIATFYSHFGATQFARALHKQGIPATPMPVPRKLSASCGTCVRFETDRPVEELVSEEVDRVARVEQNEYVLVYENE